MWITGIPLTWLVIVTFTAAWEKIFSDQPRLGFLAEASGLQAALDAGKVAAANVAATQAQMFNARLDAFLCGLFIIMVATILFDSVRVWIGVLRGTRESILGETPFVPSHLRPEEL